jgi:hypothetical protein
MDTIPTDVNVIIRFLLTPAGLGTAIVVIIGLLKRLQDRPDWLGAIGRWVRDHAMAMSLILAAVLGTGVYLVQAYNLSEYLETVWPVVVLVLNATTWAMSQGIYNAQKHVSNS